MSKSVIKDIYHKDTLVGQFYDLNFVCEIQFPTSIDHAFQFGFGTVQQDKNLLTSFRTQANEIREAEVTRALRDLARDGDAEGAILRLSQNLTNKLIHPATAAMREASAEDRQDLLGYLSSIYAPSVSSLTDSIVAEEAQSMSKPADTQPTKLED